ncbi:site-2 protease family protein [Candidatus Daviesbacteria bacterium]|nr:site-2 protease family protein [Candidatus Daviesbacteria bacterium]
MAESLAFSILILLFSVIVHEVMHGFVALKFGDRTAERAGRLTLNPIPHIDPVGTILLPMLMLITQSGFLIGWAKPVPVNPLHFSDIKRGELFVSLAGIMANFGLAIAAAAAFHLSNAFFGAPALVQDLLIFTVRINLLLAIFNLFPIPPLDGSKVLLSFLPYKAARAFERYSAYGIFILFILLYLGIIGTVLRTLMVPLHQILGVPLI